MPGSSIQSANPFSLVQWASRARSPAFWRFHCGRCSPSTAPIQPRSSWSANAARLRRAAVLLPSLVAAPPGRLAGCRRRARRGRDTCGSTATSTASSSRRRSWGLLSALLVPRPATSPPLPDSSRGGAQLTAACRVTETVSPRVAFRETSLDVHTGVVRSGVYSSACVRFVLA